MGGIGAIIGKRMFEVEFTSISSAPSTFDVEIKYWQDSLLRSEIVGGPGSKRFMANCACVQKIRFRSHTNWSNY